MIPWSSEIEFEGRKVEMGFFMCMNGLEQYVAEAVGCTPG